MDSSKAGVKDRKIFFRLAVCSAILVAGIAAMAALSSLKKPPAQAVIEEQAYKVEVLQAHSEDVPVTLTGYGEVHSIRRVHIASEVSGTVIAVHPRLFVGEIIAEGDILFQIDPRDTQSALAEAEALVSQLEHTVTRLEKEWGLEKRRLRVLQRSRDLAWAEYQRLQRLYDESRVGTKSGVEAAERAYNQALDQLQLLEQSLALYPVRLREARSSLEAARAQRQRALVQVERCTVRAPFAGRVVEKSIELGQFLSPGTPALTLADDSLLEILVPLDSDEARRWLTFDEKPSATDLSWFHGLRQVPCQVRWVEDPQGHRWKGFLHRVVAFDRTSRTLTVAVRVSGQEASGKGARMPLVDGMFCAVDIPGRTLQRVVRLPQWAVTYDNKVYLSVNGRLKTVPVRVARLQGKEAFIEEGIGDGDWVIITRLVNPLENMRLEVASFENPSSKEPTP
ncbi:efflux RND transporter periplasmic adaptor subunit [Desulfosoma caldarium]|uniref:HlyD family secretion protein n=1 Tax=Desulfosoma caldarium TaxID=610254 RepID=A0A3N1VK88_9BACT|nr:HlyD family efflux transporter periplasmic adaptor subunit [Desulfosoma caldarium]ROR03225.1 HlyD family secretion protein [Desulfosoma caldarium]